MVVVNDYLKTIDTYLNQIVIRSECGLITEDQFNKYYRKLNEWRRMYESRENQTNT